MNTGAGDDSEVTPGTASEKSMRTAIIIPGVRPSSGAAASEASDSMNQARSRANPPCCARGRAHSGSRLILSPPLSSIPPSPQCPRLTPWAILFHLSKALTLNFRNFHFTSRHEI